VKDGSAAPAATAASKSEGQQLLERMLKHHERLNGILVRLDRVRQSVGLDGKPPQLAEAQPITASQFFPGMRLIADEIDKTADEIDRIARDLFDCF
jgi:hypothetical protein